MKKIKRTFQRHLRLFKADPLDYVLTLVRAHRKVVLAGLTVLLVQVVDNDTADWIVGIVGTVLTGGVPNNERAVDVVYPNRRERRR